MKHNNVTRGFGLLEGFLAKKRADKANSFIPKKLRSGRILDVGCGSYPYFLTTTDFAEKYGLDPVIEQKLVNENSLKLIKASVGIKKLPFADNFFDVVTMLAVFEHIDNKKLVLTIKETRRVLKKNGILIITTPASWSDKLLHQMAKVHLISPEEIHEHKHNYKREEITAIINNGGFKNYDIRSGYFELYMNMWFSAQK